MIVLSAVLKPLATFACVCVLWCAPAAMADPFNSESHGGFLSTHLIEATQNTSLSLRARTLSRGGFETAGGDWVALGDWYSADWKDTRLSWMTQLTPHLGLIWGLSTGERAKKYVIDPGLRIGFLFQSELGKNNLISVSFSSTVGGRLKEKTCTADYGEMAGVQQVNCRLAASALAPAETLKYMINEKPTNVAQLRYQFSFK